MNDLKFAFRQRLKNPGFSAVAALTLALGIAPAAVSVKSAQPVPTGAIERIKREAFENSQVMDYAFQIAELHGPRFTGSPGFQAAGNWVVDRLRGFGLENVRKETIPWGRGWSCQKFSADMLEPQYAPLVGLPPPPSAEWPVSLFAEVRRCAIKLNQFFKDEGALALIKAGRGEGGSVVAFGPDWAREGEVPPPLPTAFLTKEHYNRIVRLLERQVPVRLAIEVKAQFHQDPAAAFNVTAEIRGTSKKNELVIVGAHLDSWTGGTGATDDAAGCAVLMEAMRILKALDLKPDRTIRLTLWAGHEGGGDHAGSKRHIDLSFGADAPPGNDRVVCYLNLDNGSGKIRGVYLPERDAEFRPLFKTWFAPLADLGAATIAPIRVPGGSDHVWFYKAGLPAFMLMQDPLDYRSRTHHSNMDLYDHLQADDLKQAAAVVACLAYQAAVETSLFPAPHRGNTR